MAVVRPIHVDFSRPRLLECAIVNRKSFGTLSLLGNTRVGWQVCLLPAVFAV